MPRRYDGPYNGPARQLDGLTVFASDGNGRTRAIVRNSMPLRDGLREICQQLDEWPGEWRIDCISTPTTVYSDLKGRRPHRNKPDGFAKRFGAEGEPPAEPPQRIEEKLLGVIGRMDLLSVRRG